MTYRKILIYIDIPCEKYRYRIEIDITDIAHHYYQGDFTSVSRYGQALLGNDPRYLYVGHALISTKTQTNEHIATNAMNI